MQRDQKGNQLIWEVHKDLKEVGVKEGVIQERLILESKCGN